MIIVRCWIYPKMLTYYILVCAFKTNLMCYYKLRRIASIKCRISCSDNVMTALQWINSATCFYSHLKSTVRKQIKITFYERPLIYPSCYFAVFSNIQLMTGGYPFIHVVHKIKIGALSTQHVKNISFRNFKNIQAFPT